MKNATWSGSFIVSDWIALSVLDGAGCVWQAALKIKMKAANKSGK